LTAALITPGWAAVMVSTLLAQDAQLMPVTGIMMVLF
jgi:hypothetical protein